MVFRRHNLRLVPFFNQVENRVGGGSDADSSFGPLGRSIEIENLCVDPNRTKTEQPTEGSSDQQTKRFFSAIYRQLVLSFRSILSNSGFVLDLTSSQSWHGLKCFSESAQVSSSPVRYDQEEFLCGFFNCRPVFLKSLASPIVFLPLFSLLAFCQGGITQQIVHTRSMTCHDVSRFISDDNCMTNMGS